MILRQIVLSLIMISDTMGDFIIKRIKLYLIHFLKLTFVLLACLLFSFSASSNPRLIKIINKARKSSYYFYVTNSLESYILIDNYFKRVPNDFFSGPNSEFVEDGRLPPNKALLRLIEVAKLKGLTVYVKGKKKIYELKPNNSLGTPSNENMSEDYYALSQESLSWKKLSLGQFNFSMKNISVASGGSVFVQYASWIPHLLIRKPNIRLNLQLGFNNIPEVNKNIFSSDIQLWPSYSFFFSNLSLNTYAGIGYQQWFGENGYLFFSGGIGVSFIEFYRVYEILFSFGSIQRSSGVVNEIKIGVNFRFF